MKQGREGGLVPEARPGLATSRVEPAPGSMPLAGKGIVVTRPVHQSVELAQAIGMAGGTAILFPTIEIVAVADPQPLLALIDRLAEFDMAIFVSPNAVHGALELVRARGAFPGHLRLAAVGQGTVRELARQGLRNVIAPTRFDSEALLDLDELRTPAGKRIVIFRGEGGRELLGATLSERGAAVEYAVCYRRRRPDLDSAPLRSARERGALHAITATGSEGLRNLYALLSETDHAWLRVTPLFVAHPRIAAAAHELGAVAVVTTAQGDDGLMEGLIAWFADPHATAPAGRLRDGTL